MARVDLSTLDRSMTLAGDEYWGVALYCQDEACRGLPVAYHEGMTPAYRDDEVAQVDSIAGLVLAAITHRTSVHGDASVERGGDHG